MVSVGVVFSSSIKAEDVGVQPAEHDRGPLALAVQLGDAVGSAAVLQSRPDRTAPMLLLEVVSMVVK